MHILVLAIGPFTVVRSVWAELIRDGRHDEYGEGGQERVNMYSDTACKYHWGLRRNRHSRVSCQGGLVMTGTTPVFIPSCHNYLRYRRAILFDKKKQFITVKEIDYARKTHT